MSQWDVLYNKTRSAQPRKLLVEALAYISHNGSVLQALDLGAGSLLNTKYLLNNGYFVTAVDSNKSGMEGVEASNLTKIISRFETFSFPHSCYDIIVATFSLPFCNPKDFSRVIRSLKQSLKNDGILCCNFFGTHDSWYPNIRMSFVGRSEVTSMLTDMETLVLDEKEFDGFDSHGNPKHWHIFDVIARKNS